jgi:hypothetical protein
VDQAKGAPLEFFGFDWDYQGTVSSWEQGSLANYGSPRFGPLVRLLPDDDAPCPVLLSYGPYGKGLAFQDGYGSAWDIMVANHPDVAAAARRVNAGSFVDVGILLLVVWAMVAKPAW